MVDVGEAARYVPCVLRRAALTVFAAVLAVSAVVSPAMAAPATPPEFTIRTTIGNPPKAFATDYVWAGQAINVTVRPTAAAKLPARLTLVQMRRNRWSGVGEGCWLEPYRGQEWLPEPIIGYAELTSRTDVASIPLIANSLSFYGGDLIPRYGRPVNGGAYCSGNIATPYEAVGLLRYNFETKRSDIVAQRKFQRIS